MPNSKRSKSGVEYVEAPSAWHALGDPAADDMVAKARLVAALDRAIKAAGLTQTQAAERLGIAQPNLSRILSGRFRAMTFDQLFKLLAGMGVDVRVTLAPAAPGGLGGVAVAGEVGPGASATDVEPGASENGTTRRLRRSLP